MAARSLSLATILAATALLAPLAGAPVAVAHNHGGETASGGPVISQPYAKATMPGAKVGAAYMQVKNTGKTPFTLVSATSPASEKVELHTMSMDGGVMRMRQITGGVTVEPGQTVSFTPGGMHLMLMGLKQQLAAGTAIPVTLTFSGAPAQTIQFPVQAMGDGGHHHH
ncbi:MAG: copper chaperone PCu(A)C [Alphaproteobacteria bacterium]